MRDDEWERIATAVAESAAQQIGSATGIAREARRKMAAEIGIPCFALGMMTAKDADVGPGTSWRGLQKRFEVWWLRYLAWPWTGGAIVGPGDIRNRRRRVQGPDSFGGGGPGVQVLYHFTPISKLRIKIGLAT